MPESPPLSSPPRATPALRVGLVGHRPDRLQFADLRALLQRCHRLLRRSRLAVITALVCSTHLVAVDGLAPAALIPVDGEGAAYWTRWRGPSGQGAVVGTNYVDAWSETRNVRWTVAVPGRGHSSPIVWKDHLFLTTARDGGTKVSMLAYRRSDGKLLW